MKSIEIKRDSFIDALRKGVDGIPIISFEELDNDPNISDCNRIMDKCISKLTNDDCILFNTYRCIEKYCEEYDARKNHFSTIFSESYRTYTNDKMSSSGFLRFEEGLQLCGRTTVLKKLGVSLKDNIDRRGFVC